MGIASSGNLFFYCIYGFYFVVNKILSPPLSIYYTLKFGYDPSSCSEGMGS